jgi:hypothetical protein
MMNFSLENLNEIIDDVLLEFCVTYPIPDFQNEEHLLHLKSILEQFGVTILDDAELMEAISLAPKKFTLEAPIKNKAVNPKDKARVDAHKKGLEGKGGNAYGPKGKDVITHRNQNGKLVAVNPPVKIGKAAQQQKVAAQQKKVVAPTKKAVAPTKKVTPPTKKAVAQPQTRPQAAPQAQQTAPTSGKKVKKVNDAIRKKDSFNTDKSMTIGLDDKTSEARAKANKAKKINTKPLFSTKDTQTIFDGKPKFPKKYLKVLERMMQYGKENITITTLTDKAGAGTLESTCGEIVGMIGLSIQDAGKRAMFFRLLKARAEQNGKAGILDASWVTAGEAHCIANERKLKRDFPNGYTILNTFWDVADEAAAIGVEGYKQNKGFSTDVNMLVMDNKTKQTKWVEPSLKKDEVVNLLNGTTNRIRSIAVLASKKVSNKEKDQYESATKELEGMGEVKKGKTPEYARKEQLQKYITGLEERVKAEIPKNANAEYAYSVQEKLHSTAWENKDVVKQSKLLLNAWAKLTPKQKQERALSIIEEMGQNDKGGLRAEIVDTINKLYKNKDSINGLDSIGQIIGDNTSRGKQKASMILLNLGSSTGKANSLSTVRDKIYKNTYAHSKAASEYLLSTNETKTALLRSIRDAFPVKSLLEGEENMLLGDFKKGKTPGTNIDQYVLQRVFNIKSAEEFQSGLKVLDTPPPPHISFIGKGKNSKPIEIAEIKSRSDGKGYGGTWKLEMSLSKKFVELCKQYDT